MAGNSEWLARKLLELEQQVQALGRGTRLGHSSLQGESILALDEDGEVLAELGTEGGAGGVVHLDGPEPPRPTAPVLEQGVGTIFVRWDGGWHPLDEGDEGEPPTTPIDFDRIEVHATTDPEATEWDEDTLAGSITQRNGGVVMIRGWDIDDVVIVRLVCRSLADKLSEPSEPAEVTVTGIDIAAIVEELDAANVELSNLDGTMFAVGAELDALAITFKNLDASIINTDDGTLAEALDDARQALEDVRTEAKDYTDDVVADAVAEIEAELDTVRTTADGKNKTFYRTTEPPAAESSEGDLWFDTDDDNRLHRRTGGVWVSAADGRVSAVQGAVDDLTADLDTVRTTADGKNSITWSPNAATGPGKAGDTWFRTSGNNIIGHWRHSGSGWVSMSLDATVIPNLDAGKINSGHIDSARIAAGSITADKLLIGGAANLVSDPEFTDLGYGWSGGDGREVVPSEGVHGSPVLRIAASDVSAGSYLGISEARSGYRAKVSGGTRYRMSAYVRASNLGADTTLVAQLYLRFFTPADKAAGTFTWGSPSNASFRSRDLVDGEWTLVSFEAVAPDGAVEAAPGLYKHSGHTTSPVEFCMPSLVAMTGATLIENGAITTEKIATGAITAESGVIGSLDAGKIVVGEMDGARLKAGTVTADKILVGGAGNLLTNPGFTGGGAGWGIASYNPIITDSGGPTGEPVLSVKGDSGLFPYLGGLGQSASASFAPDLTVVEAGKRYTASVWVRAEVDIPVGNAGMGFRLRELGAATLGWTNPSTATNREVIPANTWAKVEGEFLVPTTTGTWNRLAFGLRANGALNGHRVEFSAPVLLPMVGSTLIEGGAVTTEKIAADAVEADKIAANAIGARAIAADAVEAGKIAADSISGREIIANTVKAEHIASFTITADELAANSVSTDKLVANSVIADKLAANSVTAEKIDALAVTADKIAANAVTADKIAANAVTAGKIEADALNFKRAVGLELSAPLIQLGDAVEITEAHGIRQFGPDGALNVDLPSDGSPAALRGDFSARRLTAQHMQLSGDMAVAASAEVVLDPGVTAPAAAPQVSAYWPRVTLPSLTSQERAVGIARGEGHWWRLVTTSVPFADGGRDRIEKIGLNGALVSEFNTSERGAVGFTYLNGDLYVLVSNVIVPQGTTVRIVNMVYVYGLDGTYKRRWEAGGYQIGTYGTLSPHWPGIGNDGTNVVVAQCNKDGVLNYWRRSPSTGALVSSHNTGDNFNADVRGVFIGSADFGGQKLLVAKQTPAGSTYRQLVVYDLPGHGYNSGLSWYTPNREAPAGLSYDGTYFWSLNGAGNLVRYSRREGARVVGDDSGNWWLAASWRNNPAESLAGPAQRFTWPHRAELLVTVPDIPQGVTGVAFFAARQTSEPVRTDLHWVAEINEAARTVIIPSMSGTWSNDRAPVSVSSFTEQQPGEIRSMAGNFRVDGLGAGTWGPLEFHEDGTMTGLPKVAAGYVAMTNQVAGQTSSLVVTLPAGVFSSNPSVLVTPSTSVPYTTVRGVSAGGASPDSFTLYVNRTNTTNTGVAWIAIERTV